MAKDITLKATKITSGHNLNTPHKESACFLEVPTAAGLHDEHRIPTPTPTEVCGCLATFRSSNCQYTGGESLHVSVKSE